MYCKSIGFIKTSEAGKNYCEYPSDCETNPNACAASQIACKAKGYVKDKSSDKCVKPGDEDCYDQNNLYACFDEVNGYCAK